MTAKIDFLGIGAQRAATTWLYRNLNRHPNIWTPPKKELHYFDRSPRYPSPSYLACGNPFIRMFGLSSPNREFKVRFVGGIWDALKTGDREVMDWTLGYYLGRVNEEWYLSLFEKGRGKFKGEITPSYSLLEPEDIRRIKDLFPHLKVVLFLRDPVERAWSFVRFGWKNRGLENIEDPEAVKRYIDSPAQSMRGDYADIIDRWSSCFPPHQFFIGFYDDVAARPRELISDIYGFLGLEIPEYKDEDNLRRKVNVSRSYDIPPEIEYYLAKKYLPQLRKLKALVGGHAVNWLSHAEEILDSQVA